MAQKTSPSPVRTNPTTPLVELGRLGQSVWLDFIQKSLSGDERALFRG